MQGVRCHYDILGQSMIITFFVVPGMVAHALNPSSWVTEAGGLL